MKNLYLIFLLLIISVGSQAQHTLKKSIPLLKESPKIDSLINSIINMPGNLRPSENDSCILLGLFKSRNDAGFISGLHALNHKQIIFDCAKFANNKNCGYFELNGYLVFVYGDDFMKEFFNNTNSKKEFTFIKPTTEEIISEMKYLMNWTVFYRNGSFNWGVH